MGHARTPGKHKHFWTRLDMGAVELWSCFDCNFWYLQPQLPLADPGGEHADEGEGDSTRHSDQEELMEALARDRKAFYGHALKGT